MLPSLSTTGQIIICNYTEELEISITIQKLIGLQPAGFPFGSISSGTSKLVGAAGFEPTITGSKPDALPLGYAPI